MKRIEFLIRSAQQFLLILILGFTNTQGHSQNSDSLRENRFSIRAGVLFSDIRPFMPASSSSHFSVSSDLALSALPGLCAGISYDYPVGEFLNIQPEFSVEMQRYNFKDRSSYNGLNLYGNTLNDFVLTTVSADISLGFFAESGNKLKTFVGVGPDVVFPFFQDVKGSSESKRYEYNFLSSDTSGNPVVQVVSVTSKVEDNEIKARIGSAFRMFLSAGFAKQCRNGDSGLQFKITYTPWKFLLSQYQIRQYNFSLSWVRRF